MTHTMRCTILVTITVGASAAAQLPPYAQVGSERLTCTRYVSTSGDDANPGTASLPWRTINKAVSNDGGLGGGTVVCVAEGTYNERVDVQVSGYMTWLGIPRYFTLVGLYGARDLDAGVSVDGGNGESIIDGTDDNLYKLPLVECPPALQINNQSYIRIANLVVTHRGFLQPHPLIVTSCHSRGISVSATTVPADGILLDHNSVRGIRTKRDEQLGVPLAFGSFTAAPVSNVQVLDSRFSDNDTVSSQFAISAVDISANAVNWLVARNRFDDLDTGGVELAGNFGAAQPTYGVISNNEFIGTARADVADAGLPIAGFASAVYDQGGKYILIERNFFDHVGHGVNVKTEPFTVPDGGVCTSHVDCANGACVNGACIVCNAVPLTTGAWIRNNVFYESRGSDLLTGANDNGLPGVCNYSSVSGVSFTNNTVFRLLPNANRSISVATNPYAGLTGSNAIKDNLFRVPDAFLSYLSQTASVTSVPFVSDYNLIASPVASTGPVTRYFNGVPAALTMAQWWSLGQDTHSQVQTALSSATFVSPTPSTRSQFALSSVSTPAHNTGAPYAPLLGGPRPTTPTWLPANGFGTYSPPVELDHFGGPRENVSRAFVYRRDLGADEF